MQPEAPLLTSEELSKKLGELLEPPAGEPGRERHDERWRRKLMAIHGRAEPQELEIAGRRVRVIPVANELELREVLPDPHDDEDIALILSYPAVEVPIDLAGRFRKRGRVVRIAKLERLRQIFTGAGRSLVELDASLIDSALARHLLGLDSRGPLRTSSGRIGLDQAAMLWLHEHWGVPERLALDNLLVFAATSMRYEEFAATMRRADARGVADELLGVLGRIAPEAPLVWRNWLAGKGRQLLAHAIVFEALEAEPSSVTYEALLSGARHLLDGNEAEIDRAARGLAGAVATALEIHGARSLLDTRLLLNEAELLVLERNRASLRGSRRLPCAWTARLDALGDALGELAADPSEARYEQVGESLRKLELHESIRLDEHRVLFERLDMARRLAAFLVVRSDRGSSKRLGKVDALAAWYASEGGFLDLARRRARAAASGDSRLAAGVRAVLAEVDALRVEQDREFAGGLAKWLDSPSRRAVPIAAVIERFAAAFLRTPGGAKRRLLVLLLDGMAWPQAVELLAELGSDTTATAWHPLAWNRKVGELEPHTSFVPVLAALPTDTSVSRSALFGGSPATPGVEPREGDDAKRWAKHPSIAPLFGGSRKPLLLIGNDAFGPEGVKTSTRTAIADAEQPVVAIVVNTIDDALKGNVDDDAAWRLDRLTGLRELFEAARVAGRRVLLCSDHGNVSGQRLAYEGVGAGGKARWRPLVEGMALRDFEVAIESPPGWRPSEPGSKGVVLIRDDAHAYSGKRNYGEHGGASLAEVVTPTVLLGCESLAGEQELGEDPMLALEPTRPPRWWVDDVREPEGRRAALEHEYQTLASALAPPSSSQLPLAGVVTPATEAELRAEAAARLAEVEAKSRAQGKKVFEQSKTTEELLDKLESNPLFLARSEQTRAGEANLRQEVLAALAYLLERRDHASAEAFATALGKHKARVGGLVARLTEVLNVDGYEVLIHDEGAKQVRLQRELLVQGFGL